MNTIVNQWDDANSVPIKHATPRASGEIIVRESSQNPMVCIRGDLFLLEDLTFFPLS